MSKPEHTQDSLAGGAGSAGAAPEAKPAPTETERAAKPASAGPVRFAKSDAVRAEAARAKAEPVEPAAPAAPARGGAEADAAAPGSTGAAEDAPAGDAPAGAEAAKTELAKTELAKTEPVKTEPAKTEPAKAVPAKAEPAKAEPAKAEAAPAEPVAAPTKAEATRVEATKIDATKVDAVKDEPSRAPEAKGGATDRAPRTGRGSSAAGTAARKARERGEGDLEGHLLAGRYRLERVLGKGGMGTVWRAVDETLGRTVAIKELRFTSGVDEDEKRRLVTRTLREAKAIARIRGTGAVTVFDVVDDDGRPWIVMELIEGASLAEVIREKGTLTPRRAAEVGLAVLDVLRAAHSQGILHRDVKPSNVLIADTGRVVLTDFGIAQVEGDPSVTSTGMLVGAPSYISPERARGQKPGPPADMWSLGGLLYAAVEGTPPYDKGSALATLTAVMTEQVDPPKNAGPLTDVIYGLLVKDPAHRLDDQGARALLSAVVDMPEPEPEPPADETRVIALPPVPELADLASVAAAPATAKPKGRPKGKPQEGPAAVAQPTAKAKAKGKGKAKERPQAVLAAAAAAAGTAAAPAVPGTRQGAVQPKGQAQEPVQPASKPRPVAAPLTDVMSRQTIALAIAAVVAALALLGGAIVWAMSGDDEPHDNKNNSKGPGSSAAPATGGTGGTPATGKPGTAAGGTETGTAGKGATAGTGTEQNDGGANGTNGNGAGDGGANGAAGANGSNGSNGSGGTAGSAGQGGTGPGTIGALPAGYVMVTDAHFHFSMAMPSDFKRNAIAGDDSGGIYNRDGGYPRVQVDYNDSPSDDARLAWAQLAGAVSSSSNGYKLLGLSEVEYRGYPTVADWQFERTEKGQRVRVLNRGFKVDATHGYAIMITCPVDGWDGAECKTLRDTAFATFKVRD
ncbi:serine/threonine-protein kinase [Streptomyces sp. NRRL S-87]|uniref:serine/threonine-protein kinase n=1 Tax=Streptomyces sp. NRRL S-87 TaxID=1463920 RepID=UPI0004BF4EED|nr:serine/threonine-protein kinase [Streptomyces sp. NRRL S-87]